MVRGKNAVVFVEVRNSSFQKFDVAQFDSAFVFLSLQVSPCRRLLLLYQKLSQFV